MPLLLVLLLLVAAPVSAVSPLPLFTPDEVPIGPGAIGSTGGGIAVTMAAGRSDFLVASTPYGGSLYVMLVDMNGAPLLEQSITMPASSGVPGVASDGENYFVAFRDASGGLTGLLIDGSGRILSTTKLHGPVQSQSTAGLPALGIDVAWNGHEYVVITSIANSGPFFATFVNGSGEVLKTDVPVAGGRIATRNGVTLISSETSPIVVQPLTGETAGDPVTLSGSGSDGDIIAGGDGFLVVWQSATGIAARHLDATGRPDQAEIDFATGQSPVPIRGTWTGSDYAVLYAGAWDARPNAASGQIDLVHLNQSGVVAGPVLLSPTFTLCTSLAFNGSSLLAAWSDVKLVGSVGFPVGRVLAGRIDSDRLMTSNVVHRGRLGQSPPAAAQTGVGTAVVWGEGNDLNFVSAVGTFVSAGREGPHIAISDAAQGSVQSVVGGASSALVIESDYSPRSEVRAIVFTPAGAVRSYTLANASNSYATTWTGNEYVVAWAQPLPGARVEQIVTMRLSADGTPLDPQPQHVVDMFETGAMAIGSNSSGTLLLVYFDAVNGPLRGAVISAGGVTKIDEIMPPFDFHQQLNVASDGTGFFVTWMELGSGIIRGRRISSGGELESDVRDYAQAPISANGQVGPGRQLLTFWTGENYLIAFKYGQSTVVDVWDLRVATDGTPIDATPHHAGAAAVDPLGVAGAGLARFEWSMLALAFRKPDGSLAVRYALWSRQRAVVHR